MRTVKHWNKLHQEAGRSPSPWRCYKTWQDKALSNPVWSQSWSPSNRRLYYRPPEVSLFYHPVMKSGNVYVHSVFCVFTRASLGIRLIQQLTSNDFAVIIKESTFIVSFITYLFTLLLFIKTFEKEHNLLPKKKLPFAQDVNSSSLHLQKHLHVF